MPPALEAEPFYLNGSQVITFLYPLLAVNQLSRELLLWGFFFLRMQHFSKAETYYGNSDTDNCVNHTQAKVIDDLIPVKYEMIRLPHGILII